MLHLLVWLAALVLISKLGLRTVDRWVYLTFIGVVCIFLQQANTNDCTAHSAIYTPGSNKIRPLFIYSDTWCSSGQFDASGQLVQTGGDADGITKVCFPY